MHSESFLRHDFHMKEMELKWQFFLNSLKIKNKEDKFKSSFRTFALSIMNFKLCLEVLRRGSSLYHVERQPMQTIM